MGTMGVGWQVGERIKKVEKYGWKGEKGVEARGVVERELGFVGRLSTSGGGYVGG